jgi:hypothetical protein
MMRYIHMGEGRVKYVSENPSGRQILSLLAQEIIIQPLSLPLKLHPQAG